MLEKLLLVLLLAKSPGGPGVWESLEIGAPENNLFILFGKSQRDEWVVYVPLLNRIGKLLESTCMCIGVVYCAPRLLTINSYTCNMHICLKESPINSLWAIPFMLTGFRASHVHFSSRGQFYSPQKGPFHTGCTQTLLVLLIAEQTGSHLAQIAVTPACCLSHRQTIFRLARSVWLVVAAIGGDLISTIYHPKLGAEDRIKEQGASEQVLCIDLELNS